MKSRVHYFHHFEFGMVVTLMIPFLSLPISFVTLETLSKGRRNNEKAFFLLRLIMLLMNSQQKRAMIKLNGLRAWLNESRRKHSDVILIK